MLVYLEIIMIHDPNLQMQCLNSFYFDVLAFAAAAAEAAASSVTGDAVDGRLEVPASFFLNTRNTLHVIPGKSASI